MDERGAMKGDWLQVISFFVNKGVVFNKESKDRGF